MPAAERTSLLGRNSTNELSCVWQEKLNLVVVVPPPPQLAVRILLIFYFNLNLGVATFR